MSKSLTMRCTDSDPCTSLCRDFHYPPPCLRRRQHGYRPDPRRRRRLEGGMAVTTVSFGGGHRVPIHSSNRSNRIAVPSG